MSLKKEARKKKPSQDALPPHTIRVKQKLHELGVVPSKRRGQNFVVEPYVIDEIITFGKPHPNEHIVEIGPGTGALTSALAKNNRLTLVEIEEKFCSLLKASYPHADVLHADVRAVDLRTVGQHLTVFANLPYAFSTDIVFHLLEHHEVMKRAVLLFQKEFSERIAASPGGRIYGVLSVMVQVWCATELGPIIPGDAFHPSTKVDSQLIELCFRTQPLISHELFPMFELVVKLSFGQRRKKAFNSILASKLFPRTVLHNAFNAACIDLACRAEGLDISQFEALAIELKSRSKSIE